MTVLMTVLPTPTLQGLLSAAALYAKKGLAMGANRDFSALRGMAAVVSVERCLS